MYYGKQVVTDTTMICAPKLIKEVVRFPKVKHICFDCQIVQLSSFGVLITCQIKPLFIKKITIESSNFVWLAMQKNINNDLSISCRTLIPSNIYNNLYKSKADWLLIDLMILCHITFKVFAKIYGFMYKQIHNKCL